MLGGTSLMGGRGSIIGSAIGALTLGIISNGLVLLRVDVYWVPIVQGIILDRRDLPQQQALRARRSCRITTGLTRR